MGLSAGGELIWGTPVHIEDTSEPHPLWEVDEEDPDCGDWKELPGVLTVRHYGHYDDPDGPRGILSTTSVPTHMGDCWEPRQIVPDSLNVPPVVRQEFADALEAAGLPPCEPKWCLVASYG